ncbi:MAG: MFS transporter [Chloroflexi bacterium]|nr:MFS transporter [Chloroflexota bacterium]MCI0855358.1 MFS transporter [Chloroflexota bacterium]MCI0889804.1 MFS transporter [Chloroflexota bacterium]
MKFPRSGLWRHPDFLRLWGGQTISAFGSLVGGAALQFTAILVLDAAPLQLAALAASTLVPGFLFGLVAGVWVDRLRRRPIMIAADIGRALVLASIPLAWAFDVLHMEHLYVVAFFTGTFTFLFDVAYRSYLPTLIQRDELIEANSKLTASSAATEVGGFGVAGWLVQLITGPLTILVDAVSFIVSALFLHSIKAPEAMPAIEERSSVLREVVEGLQVVVRDPLLRATAISSITLDFSMRIFGTVVLLYMIQDLGFGPGVLGMIFAVGGVSSLLGSVVAARAGRTLGLGRVMVLGLVVFGLSQLLIPIAQGPMAVVAMFLIVQQFGDGAYVVREISEMSLRQAITPEPFLGRQNASFQFGGIAAMLVGTLVGGVLGEVIGLRWTLVVGAGGTFVSAFWLLVSQVRSVVDLPDQAPSWRDPA